MPDIFRRILVLSKLSLVEESRNAAIELLKAGGIDHVIEFATIFHCVAKQVEMNKNGSDLGDYADNAAAEDLQDGQRGRRGRVVRGSRTQAGLIRRCSPALAFIPRPTLGRGDHRSRAQQTRTFVNRQC